MKLNTKCHGVIEYTEENIITFKKGLPGFEKLKKFILVPLKDNDLFSVLHSVEDYEIGFIAISPFKVIKEYEFKLDDNKLKELNITSKEQVIVVNTVTLNSNIENITVNLRAPIVINNAEKLALQVILNNDKYLVKHPLIEGEK